jgi:hypothetical protein
MGLSSQLQSLAARLDDFDMNFRPCMMASDYTELP